MDSLICLIFNFVVIVKLISVLCHLFGLLEDLLVDSILSCLWLALGFNSYHFYQVTYFSSYLSLAFNLGIACLCLRQ